MSKHTKVSISRVHEHRPIQHVYTVHHTDNDMTACVQQKISSSTSTSSTGVCRNSVGIRRPAAASRHHHPARESVAISN